MTLTELVTDSHDRAVRKGWWDDQLVEFVGGDSGVDPELARPLIPEKLALIHSEVSEVLEEHRNGHEPTEIYFNSGKLKPEGIPVELADILIRVFDLAGALGIDLEDAVKLKAVYNETRPHRHGGKTC